MMWTRRCNPGFAVLLVLAFAGTTVSRSSTAGERPAYVPPPKLSSDLPSTAVATGPRFHKALQDVLPGASWKQTILREALGQLAEGHSVSILRDRRVDPTAVIELSESTITLGDVLSRLAGSAHAETRTVGNVVYIAPADTAKIVRTLVALRDEELASDRFRRVSPRQTALRRSQTVRWADLTTPADALNLVADRFNLRIEDRDLIPHDLWERAVFANMTSSEMLALILGQFDLTFEWGSDLESVRIVPLPEDRAEIALRRVHRPRTNPGDALALWKEQAGDLQATVQGETITVLARIEQHELIEQLIRGKRAGETERPAEPVPLSRRQFTLTVSGVPASAVIKQLEASGITFDFDAKALETAGIDFEKPISMNVRQVGPEAFLRELFEPLGLQTRFTGTRVTLELPESPR